jgi:prevent-host-death family protein
LRKVNIHEAKTTLSRLVQAAESGETILLARAGKPVARLVGLEAKRGIRLGVLRGKLPASLLDDVVKPLTRRQIEALFGGTLEP